MKRSKLKEITLHITDGEHATVEDTSNGSYYLLSNKNIVDGNIVINDEDRKISEKTYNKINRRTLLDKNDIVISTVGTIGKIALIKEKPNFEFQRSVGIIKCNSDVLLPEYLMYYLNLSDVQNRLRSLSKGAVQKCLFIKDLEDFIIDYPDSVEKQRDIIKSLVNIDIQIERNNAMVQKLQDLAQTTYSRWFNQFEFPNEEGKPYKSSGGKLVYNEELKKEIPIDWDFTHLEKLIKENPKSTIKAGEANNGEYPFFNSGESILRYSTPIIKGKNCFLNTGGTAGVKYFTKECSYSTDTWCITSLENYEEYLYLYLSSIIAIINNSYFAGSGLKHLQKSTFKEIKLLYPNIKIMQKFSNIISPIYDKISNNYFENQKLNILKNQLLPLLINGQLI